MIHDHNGKFIAASNRKIEHVLDPATSEALALRDGIKLANQVGYNRLIMQSDC